MSFFMLLSSPDKAHFYVAKSGESLYFKSEKRLKFGPGDKIMDVYRSLYPSPGWPDALELESLAKNLQRIYKFELAKTWNPELTLGQLFEMIQGAKHKESFS